MLTLEDWADEDANLGRLNQKMLIWVAWNPKDAYLGRLDSKTCLPRKTGRQKMLT
jgi:hypothetical protein